MKIRIRTTWGWRKVEAGIECSSISLQQPISTSQYGCGRADNVLAYPGAIDRTLLADLLLLPLPLCCLLLQHQPLRDGVSLFMDVPQCLLHQFRFVPKAPIDSSTNMSRRL